MCLYQNQMPPALDNNGLWVPYGESYTVSEAGLPTGWYGIEGIGTFPANWGACDGTTCLHTVKNQSSSGGRVVVTKTVDWSASRPIRTRRLSSTFARRPPRLPDGRPQRRTVIPGQPAAGPVRRRDAADPLVVTPRPEGVHHRRQHVELAFVNP